jgi:CubicO group peptidase (beta-lactamase class C family)
LSNLLFLLSFFMRQSYLILLPFLLLAGCEKIDSNSIPPHTAAGILIADSYRPPVFTDSTTRLALTNTFPVVEKIYRDYAVQNHFPGLAFGIVSEGKLIYAGAFGVLNVETKKPADSKTIFRIASMSKSFTAIAILKLRDEGRLNLQDPAAQYISQLKNVRYLTQDSPAITIEHLLTMSAGFPEDNPWGDRQLADTQEELLALITNGIAFSNTPGITFEYSNLGFAVLGQIITNITGKPYQEYITENILLPLNMKDTYYEFEQAPSERLALGYRWEDEQWKEEPMLHDGTYGAMGGILTTIEDFSKYVAFHASAWPARNEEESGPLKRSSLREMHQLQRFIGLFPENKTRMGENCPVISGYGYGLSWRKDCQGLVRISHSGGLPGFGSEWRFYPEYKLGVVSFSNGTYGAPSLANAKAIDTLITLAKLKPMVLPVSEILEERQQQIMRALSDWPHAQEQKIFAENFYLDESFEFWTKRIAALLSQTGKLIGSTPVKPENQLRGMFTVQGEKNNLAIYFTLTPETPPLIQQLDITLQPK